jgi:integrase
MCLEYLDERCHDVSPAAANEDLGDLKAFFNHLRQYYGLADNPASRLEPYGYDPIRQYTPPKEDILKVVMAAKGQDRVMVDIFRFTGARRSEILRLTWDDILFDKRVIRLKTKKTKNHAWRIRYAAMNGVLFEQLNRHYHGRDKSSPFVFTTHGRPYQRREIWLKGLCERAGVKPFGFHAFRRYFASTMIDLGASLKETSDSLGHTAIRTTERYVFNINPRLRDLVEMMDGENAENLDKIPHGNTP